MTIHMKMILLSVVMLLIGLEPAFSGKILKKLNKELKKMGLQKLVNFLAEIGTNADEIDSNKAHIANNTVDIGGVQNDMVDVQNDIVNLYRYPDVHLTNNLNFNVSGEVKYASILGACKNDHYNVPSILYDGINVFTHKRGVCLITHITGTAVNGNVCAQYTAHPGTSYHKFAIISKDINGCQITRVVN